MSRVRADRFSDREGSGAPRFDAGIVVAGVSTFSGNVSIAGTLTYDDVTNIDSVGLITARSGINVSAGGINATGIVTATSFHGDGSALSGTGIAGVSTTGHTTLNTLVSAGSTFKGDVYFATAGTPQSHGSLLKQSSALVASATSGNLNIDLKNGNVLLYNSTSNANSAFYVNFRYDSTTALSTQTINGDVITATIIWCSTGTSSYINVVDIDGVTQTVNWVGGSAPSDGSGSNKFDIYTFTMFDTGAGWTVFGNQTKC